MYKTNKLVVLSSQLLITDETIYLNDVSTLSKPNLEIGVFGIIIINGERITYRELNTTENTVSAVIIIIVFFLQTYVLCVSFGSGSIQFC